MKKLFVIPMIALFLIASIVIVSADTMIAGKIYNHDYTITVPDATVDVTCNGNIESTTSLSDGSYTVTYDEILCGYGHSLIVDASHPSYGIGSESGIVHDELVFGLDIGIVNVPLIPEFGFFVGALTIMGAIGVFFFIRKR